MLLGYWSGCALRGLATAAKRIGLLIGFGLALITLGLAAHYTEICPIVKRIWTPSFAVTSGGICAIWLAIYYLFIDVLGWRRWAFPLTVIGMNSIAIYVMDWTMASGTLAAIDRHFGAWLREVFPTAAETVMHGCVMLVFWLILFWMYRNKVFLKI